MNAAQSGADDRARPKTQRGRGEHGSAKETSAGAGSPVWAPFADALSEFYVGAADAWRRGEVEEQAGEAFGNVLMALKRLPDAADVHNRTLEAQRKFAERTRDLTADSEGQQRLAKAYADYVTEATDFPGSADLTDDINAAYGDYLNVLADASRLRDVQARAAKTYEAYVRALRDAWASVDPEALDVGTLAGIAQSIMSAAQTHAATLSVIGRASLASRMVGVPEPTP